MRAWRHPEQAERRISWPAAPPVMRFLAPLEARGFGMTPQLPRTSTAAIPKRRKVRQEEFFPAVNDSSLFAFTGPVVFLIFLPHCALASVCAQ